MSDEHVIATHHGPTYQGSGKKLGELQYFVRLAGCSITQCPIRSRCDERLALQRSNGSRLSTQDLLDHALDAVGEEGYLHITGGEPMDQRDQVFNLVYRAHERGLRVHLQTSGAIAVGMPIDWLTVSPKVPISDLAQISGHELIVVYDNQPLQELKELEMETDFTWHFLQPYWGEDGPMNSQETVKAVDELNASGNKWRLTLQAHKYWGIR